MSYRFDPRRQYLMPTHFGPMAGPRHSPEGTRFSDPDHRVKETYSVSFLSDEVAIANLLPEGLELAGEPVVTVTFSYMTNIAWLAGRGYNMLGVTVPVHACTEERSVTGPFLLVLWENLADPIITGREQLGFNKIYGEIPEPSMASEGITCRAAWLGHQFATMTLALSAETPISKTPVKTDDTEQASLLHYRYIPKIGYWGEAAVREIVISPARSASGSCERTQTGAGKIDFHPTRWQDMPTQFHIVEGLRALPQIAPRGGEFRRIRGGGDHYHQEVLRVL
jgi:hypothetical protein